MPGCPILLAFFATGPALSEAEGVGILTRGMSGFQGKQLLTAKLVEKIRKVRRENLNCILCVLGESSALSAVKRF